MKPAPESTLGIVHRLRMERAPLAEAPKFLFVGTKEYKELQDMIRGLISITDPAIPKDTRLTMYGMKVYRVDAPEFLMVVP